MQYAPYNKNKDTFHNLHTASSVIAMHNMLQDK